MVSAGCAIGIGNVWRFPYVAGEYGGSVVVLFYLLFLGIMGAPVLAMELSVGRKLAPILTHQCVNCNCASLPPRAPRFLPLLSILPHLSIFLPIFSVRQGIFSFVS